MSFPLRSLSSRLSSGNQKPRESEVENHRAQDTAGLTGEGPETARLSKKQPLFTRIFSDTWTLEILCWLLALISLVIILIVLGIFNGQPLQNWNSGLTLNTLINVVSQIAQTAVFVPVAASISQMKWIWHSRTRPVGEMEDFDKASRGPLDSLWLVAKHPRWILVYLGALNTSLILLLGPFAQQSLSLPLLEVNSTVDSASVPFAAHYQTYLSTQTLPLSIGGSDGLSPITFQTIPPLMKVAITNGLLTQTTIDPSAVAADCGTGNCTFPEYTSLAVCSSVVDVTPTIQVSCPRGQRKTDPGCVYTVPSLKAVSSDSFTPNDLGGPTVRGDNFTTTSNSGPSNHPGGPTLWIGASQDANYLLAPRTLTDFYMLFFPDPNVLSKDSKANVTASLVALKVSVFLCLKTYNTTVTNGRTLTKVTDVKTPIFSQDSLPVAGANPTSKITTTDRKGTEFYMEGATRSAFKSFLAIATFYGTYSPSTPENANLARNTDSDAGFAFGNIFYSNPPPGDHIAAIRPLLTNLETAMSNGLRETAIAPSNVTGTATSNQIYISVDFRWLVLPILCLVLSLLFLIAVAVETRRKDVPLWKDGFGKVLCAVEPETRARMEALEDTKAGRGSVPMVVEREGGQGWWLRGPREEWWSRKRGAGGT